MVFLRSLPDKRILVGWQCPECHLPTCSIFQTHLSHRFYLAMDFLGPRRTWTSSEIIDQAQDIPEQRPRRRHPGQLERDVPTMADNFGPDLDQLLAQRGDRPTRGILGLC